MSFRPPFTPKPGATESIAVTSSSASATIAAGEGNVALVYNTGSALAYFRYGIGAQTAVTTDCPIAGGDAYLVSISDTHDTVFAAIRDSSDTTLKITPGYGG